MSIEGRRGPLLRAADLKGPIEHEAQRALIEDMRDRIEADGSTFLSRFDRAATKIRSADLRSANDVWDRRLLYMTFQIHTYKLLEELTAFLTEKGLAWTPAPELADGMNYLEMHPALGEAVMATLAMACAENEALHVITEFPELHRRLLGIPCENILAATLDDSGPSGIVSGQQIAEFLVYQRCDVDRLSAEALSELHEERHIFADFRTKIDELAASLPDAIPSNARREEYLNERVNELLNQWRQNQSNLGPKGRRFFGEGALSAPGKLAEKMTEAAVLGMLAPQLIWAAVAGCVVAVVFHGVESNLKVRREAKNGPLRYITKMQDQGVSFSIAP
jgi:hypothetical protein